MRKLCLVILAIMIVALSVALGVSVSRNLRVTEAPADEMYTYTFDFSTTDPNGEFVQYVNCEDLKTCKDVIMAADFDGNEMELKRTEFSTEDGVNVVGYTDSGNSDYAVAFINVQTATNENCFVSSSSMGVVTISTTLKLEKIERPKQDMPDGPIVRHTFNEGHLSPHQATAWIEIGNVYLPTDKTIYIDVYTFIFGEYEVTPDHFELQFTGEGVGSINGNSRDLFKWDRKDLGRMPSIRRMFDPKTGKLMETYLFLETYYCEALRIEISY